MVPDPGRINTPATPGPIVLRLGAGAGDMKFKVRVLFLQLAKFSVENNVLGLANAVEDGNARGQFAACGFADVSTKRRDTRTPGNANEMFVVLVNGQKFSDGRDDKEFIAGLCPIHDTCAHFAVAFDGNFIEAAVECARGKR